jgi:luciferase-like monooxygenase
VSESIQQAIVRAVSAWPGVTAGPHRFGGVELKLGRRELGHVHGNRLADLPFPLLIRWVSYYMRDESDIAPVVALFRLNYDRPWVEGRTQAPPLSLHAK